MKYYHVDVFSNKVLSGNGLTVVIIEKELEQDYMQKLAREFKQFETIFLLPLGNDTYRGRIFTVEEELDFAGHPILGAAAVMHEHFHQEEKAKIKFILNKKTVVTDSRRLQGYYEAKMNQGIPIFLGCVPEKNQEDYLKALNLTRQNLHKDYPMEVISTGLPYLIIPLESGLENSKIIVDNFEDMLKEVNAKFVYMFDLNHMEGRTWDNFGMVEDVATGSAAGPMAAYLIKHGIQKQEMVLHQGRFVGRPSEIKVSKNHRTNEIEVTGDVAILAIGSVLFSK